MTPERWRSEIAMLLPQSQTLTPPSLHFRT
jgi:hypothetical protein